MARDRSDTRWSQTREPWQRLAWARATHGQFANPTSFARAARMQPHTYAAYERDPDTASTSIKLDLPHAREFAQMLDVRWEWLLDGQGAPYRDEARTFSPDALSVAEMIDSQPEAERPELVAAFKTLLRRTA